MKLNKLNNDSFNSQEYVDNKQEIVGDYLNNSFDERKFEGNSNNIPNNSFNNSNNNFDNFEDKYSNYIYVDEFNDFNRNPNFQNDFQRDFQNDLRYGKNFPDDDYYIDDNHYYMNNLGKKDSKVNKSSSSSSSFFNLKDLKNKLINSNDSSKKNFGLIAICLIVLVLGASVFYFGIYQPFQNELSTEKTAKLNELNALYKGPLALNSHVYTLENQIEDSYNIEDVKSIDVLRIATEDWRDYHISKINAFEDAYGRIMMSYSENNIWG